MGSAADDHSCPTLLDQMLRDSGASVETPSFAPAPAPASGLDASDFGSGLRRGFFHGDGPPRHRKAKEKQPGMPTVKPTAPQSSLVLPEVQAAMEQEATEAKEQRAHGLPPALQALARGDWMTNELQQRILATPELRQAFLNPRFVQILDELGRDPKAALQKHKEDPAVGSLLLTLSGLLGEHFEALGQQESPALPQGPLIDEALRKRAEASKIIDVTERTPGAWAREMAEQAAAEQILSDPEVRILLLDPAVQATLQACRDAESSGGRGGREALARRLRDYPEMVGKLRRLAKAGVVRFE